MKKGLDISHYQANINFEIFKNNGIEFLILRAGFTGWGTGVDYNKDKSFEHFYEQSKKYNIPVGAYWYSCANTYEKGVAEGKFMYENCLKGKQFEFPIYIDVEDSHHQENNKKGVTDAIKGFCETLENLGYYVGIYASDVSGFSEKMYIDELKDYDKWVARYGTEPKYVKDYEMWQTTSSGRIEGFNENLDCNIAYFDYESVIKKSGLNGFGKNENNEQKELSDHELALQVLDGVFGNDDERKQKLGNRYDNVQKIVNEMLSNRNEQIYVVKSGDTLSAIALKFNTTYQKIAKDNNIENPDIIYTGQKLVIK